MSSSGSVDFDRELLKGVDETISDILGGGGGTDGRDDESTLVFLLIQSLSLILLSLFDGARLSPIGQGGGLFVFGILTESLLDEFLLDVPKNEDDVIFLSSFLHSFSTRGLSSWFIWSFTMGGGCRSHG